MIVGTRVRPREKKLPKWWPVSVLQPGLVLNAEQYKREANWLIQGQCLVVILGFLVL